MEQHPHHPSQSLRTQFCRTHHLDQGLEDMLLAGAKDRAGIPVNPTPMDGPAAEEMRRWGSDPALGRSLIRGLEDIVTVVAFDYEGHLLETPKPDTLTPVNVAADFLAVADAAGADTFAYYGYSWLAVSGL